MVKSVLFCIIAILFSIGGTCALFYGFRIQNIYIEGDHVTFDIDQSKVTRNLLFFPSEKVRQSLLLAFPIVKDIEIQKMYPSTLKFIVTQRLPLARLVTHDQSFVLDEDGYAIGTPDEKTKTLVPLYFDVPMQEVGEKVKSDPVQRALHIFREFPKEYPIIKIESIEKQSIRVVISQSDIFFPQEGDVVEHIRTLQTLLAGFRIKGAMPAHIDLRFGKPIVR